jgi:hypothetical protein
MNRQKLDKAIAEARRFIERGEKLITEQVRMEIITPGTGRWYWPPTHSGGIRRASMELTRALADLRRSN